MKKAREINAHEVYANEDFSKAIIEKRSALLTQIKEWSRVIMGVLPQFALNDLSRVAV